MKSGLKVIISIAYKQANWVSTYAAMKSGLKEYCDCSPTDLHPLVSTYAAMKSGLKVLTYFLTHLIDSRLNLCRDEKRTEQRHLAYVVTFARMKRNVFKWDKKISIALLIQSPMPR